MDARDWVLLLTAIIQLYTAILINRKEAKKKEPKNAATHANVNRFLGGALPLHPNLNINDT
ncbi:hypothetical protein B1222_01850 [Paenibacillus larvae subsp. pulvifaciens]|uniref:hypothetical protein n=1 Tax=Paenibacillus larvae TaxID=1464 RepID=UPI00098E9F47|nr:hypothetical protein [Paenibacillus larvae]AQT83462.1 hypothetical protein B1222_01850 [Paenibacillus larvae subsp. pulvifaciens]